MRTRSTLTALAVMACLLAPGAAAQESEDGQIWRVRIWKVAPGHAMQFTQGVQGIAKAAGEAELAPEWGWTAWADFPEYLIATPLPNMAAMDDPAAWRRQFNGTAGEATIVAAMETLEPVQAQVVLDEIVQEVPAWGYEPEMQMEGPPGGASMTEFWIAPGKYEDFTAAVAEANAMRKQVGYPYSLAGFSVRVGDTTKIVFVTFFDSLENFYGKNNFDRLLAEKGMSQKWGELVSRALPMLVDIRGRDLAYAEDMSHWPM